MQAPPRPRPVAACIRLVVVLFHPLDAELIDPWTIGRPNAVELCEPALEEAWLGVVVHQSKSPV